MVRKSRLMLGLDLGGTSMMLVAMDARGKVHAERSRTTKPELGAEGVTARIADTIERLSQDLGPGASRLAGICIGAPGAVDTGTGVVSHAPNLGWIKYPLTRKLGRQISMPILLDNDVNVAAVGEQALGAARGARDMVAIFVGTGIGGGIIIGGQLYYGKRGSAGEIGHVKILADGPICGCGRRGCVEALASRTAMERDIEGAIKAGRRSILPEVLRRMGRDRITSSVIETCLREKDPLVTEVYSRAQEYLGLLVASVVNLLDPECIVIGGGLVERLGESYLGPIRATARRHIMRLQDAERVRIVASTLLDHAGAVGAAVLAWRRFRGSELKLGARS